MTDAAARSVGVRAANRRVWPESRCRCLEGSHEMHACIDQESATALPIASVTRRTATLLRNPSPRRSGCLPETRWQSGAQPAQASVAAGSEGALRWVGLPIVV